MQKTAIISETPPPTTQYVAETVIRETVRSSQLPIAHLISIARELWLEHPDPVAAWDLAALEGEADKPRIETRSGHSLSTEDAAARLNVSLPTIRNMVGRADLISYQAVQGRGWRFPLWQFAGSSVRPWVPAVLRAYGHNGWGVLDFLTVPRTTLDGENYLALLKAGQLEPVLAAAHRANPD